MPKHKLYRDSFQSPNFNSSMENAEDATVIPVEKEGTPENKNHSDCTEIDSDQYSENSDYSEIEKEKEEDSNFLSEYIERRPYTYEEDVEILNFVLKDQNIYRVSSILLWKYLEAKKKNPRRTYQSLKNRFLRNIKPKIFVMFRHLIKNEDQIKRILDKFPELQKDAKKNQPPLLKLNPRKGCDRLTEFRTKNANSSDTTEKTGTRTPSKASTPVVIPEAEAENGAIVEGTGVRKVEFSGRSIIVTLTRDLGCEAPLSAESHVEIYQKYLNCKAKNKLVQCPTCGRGGPNAEPSQVQDSENENDVIIPNSIGNKNSESSQNKMNRSESSQNKISSSGSSPNKRKCSKRSSNKRNSNESFRNVRNSASDKRSEKAPAVTVKNAKRRKSRRTRSPSSDSLNSSRSPSLLENSRSSIGVKTRSGSRRSRKSTPAKSTSSSASEVKFVTPAEQPSEDLTDEELDLLYKESVQKCEKLMSSDEEEALVKKCFKKNRRALGFDSYVSLTRCNLDTFFANSLSPSFDGLSADPVTSPETTEMSPLVANMKKMLSQKNKKL